MSAHASSVTGARVSSIATQRSEPAWRAALGAIRAAIRIAQAFDGHRRPSEADLARLGITVPIAWRDIPQIRD